ncbi:hypothetical protein M501DRAFT_1002811 [Patellaria atrata CBS 101060]|uniref:Uncharacterized protein n=1 Tax=Patellaria atrata CBS 101060 TaxID=1346257 RepID=A0A9P4SD06_9PEZI|nr:hypothetical protein M501DRAFT_1002811 [Patellaria atrata CBS 101060]
MSSGTPSGGVRNLRAMFENPDASSSSPEPRGRSPVGSVTSNGTAGEQRPTPKIRASFVPVEPHPHLELGTTKGIPEGVNSPSAQRRESFSVSDDSPAADLRKTISKEANERKESNAVAEAIPEQAIEKTPAVSRSPKLSRQPTEENAGSILKTLGIPTKEKLSADPDKPTAVEESPVSMKPSDSTNKEAISGGAALPPPAESIPPIHDSSAAKLSSDSSQPPAKTTAKKTTTSTTPGATKTNGVTKKPAALAVAKDSSGIKPASRSPRSPLPKTPTTPNASSPAKTTTKPSPAPKPASKAPTTGPGKTSLRASTSTTATALSTAPKAQTVPKAPTQPKVTTQVQPKATIQAQPKASTTSATKPTKTSPTTRSRTKSPTKPIKLPSHLVAPTASSTAKHDVAPPAKSTTLGRKPSTITQPAASSKSSRPSLGPPPQPKKQPERSESRASATSAAPASFLERMMRPTASSSQKTHDKVEVKSPPRRTASTKASGKNRPSGVGTVEKAKEQVSKAGAKVKTIAKSTGLSSGQEEKSSEELADMNGAIQEKGNGVEAADVAAGANVQDTAPSTDKTIDTPAAEPAAKDEHTIAETPGVAPAADSPVMDAKQVDVEQPTPQHHQLQPEEEQNLTQTPEFEGGVIR